MPPQINKFISAPLGNTSGEILILSFRTNMLTSLKKKTFFWPLCPAATSPPESAQVSTRSHSMVEGTPLCLLLNLSALFTLSFGFYTPPPPPYPLASIHSLIFFWVWLRIPPPHIIRAPTSGFVDLSPKGTWQNKNIFESTNHNMEEQFNIKTNNKHKIIINENISNCLSICSVSFAHYCNL